MEFNAENPEQPQTQALLRSDQTRLGKFTDMVVARDGGLWITGERGLGKASKLAGRTPGTIISRRNRCKSKTCASRAKMTKAASPSSPNPPPADKGSWRASMAKAGRCSRPAGKISGARGEATTRFYGLLTSNALFRQAPGQTNLAEYQEISARQYFDVAMEPGGTFWLATSGGLFHYTPPLWRSPRPLQRINSPVRCLAEDDAGRLWFVADGKLHSLQGEIHREFALPEPAAHDAQSIRALFPLKDGTLLLDAGEHPLRFNPDSGAFGPGLHLRDDVRHVKPLGLLRDGSLCCAKLAFRSGHREIDHVLFRPV